MLIKFISWSWMLNICIVNLETHRNLILQTFLAVIGINFEFGGCFKKMGDNRVNPIITQWQRSPKVTSGAA